MTENYHPRKRYAVLIQIFHNSLREYDTDEMRGLLKTAGYDVRSYISQSPEHLNSQFFLGAGKMQTIRKSLKYAFASYLGEKIDEELLETLSPEDFKGVEGDSDDPDMYEDARDLEEIDLSYFGVDYLDSEDSTPHSDDEIDNDVRNDSDDQEESLIELNFPETLESRRDVHVIFNNRLDYMQILNLQRQWGVTVLDRDGVVLEIFEQHARTKESKLQIELARITHQTNIIKRELGEHLNEKQGRDFQGKGRRGWEPQMRLYRERKSHILKELDKIASQRSLRRKRRSQFFNIGIIGYTNAGKSTLLNALAKNANVETANQEFTTVSTTSRKVIFPTYGEYQQFIGEEFIFTDSVGFVEDIAYNLIDAFLSTLEELQFSDVLLVIVDVSEAAFSRVMAKLNSSFRVMSQIGALDIPKIIALNKIDQLEAEELAIRHKEIQLTYSSIPIISLSARDKQGFETLATTLIDHKHRLYFPKHRRS